MGGGHAQVVTEGVDLLDIQNKLALADGDAIQDVFMFGASLYEEQDQVVNGIKI
jgi:hypothetical protein